MFKSRVLLFIALAGVLVFGFTALAFAQGTPTVQLTDNATIGQKILTGPNGMTLYQYTKDTAGVSNCSGGCLAAWPALTVTQGTSPSAAADVTGRLGTITRTDNGQTQVTINDMPLYYWAKDKAPGDATGQDVGKVWYVVAASGDMIKTSLAATPTATVAPTAAPTTTPAAASSAVTSTTATTSTTAKPPSALPTTGGAGSGSLLVMLGGLLVLALGAGLALNTVRRAR